MFEDFRAKYAALRDPTSGASEGWRDDRFDGVEGYAQFMAEFAGASFGGGLYRVHDEQSGPQGLTLISAAFPEFAARVMPFGYDWLGRQFAVDSGRLDRG